MIIPGMVSHPVDDHFHAEVMSGFDQLTKIIGCTIVRVDIGIGTGCIVTAIGALSFFDTDRGDRHQPQDVYCHVMQAANVLDKCLQRAFPGVLSHVDFVDVSAIAPGNNGKSYTHLYYILYMYLNR